MLPGTLYKWPPDKIKEGKRNPQYVTECSNKMLTQVTPLHPVQVPETTPPPVLLIASSCEAANCPTIIPELSLRSREHTRAAQGRMIIALRTAARAADSAIIILPWE